MVHRFGQSSKDYSVLPHNWEDDLSWNPDKVCKVSTLEGIVTHWTRPMVNHDVKLSIVMIYQATLLHGLST